MQEEPLPDSARKLAAKRANERIKHVASFLNALGIGTIAAGLIIPATRTPMDVAPISLLWLCGGLVLHLAGHGAYVFLRSED